MVTDPWQREIILNNHDKLKVPPSQVVAKWHDLPKPAQVAWPCRLRPGAGGGGRVKRGDDYCHLNRYWLQTTCKGGMVFHPAVYDIASGLLKGLRTMPTS